MTSPTPRGWRSVRASDWAAAAVGVLLLLYCVLRATTLPILFDEAYTYLAFVRAPMGSLLNPLGSDRPIDANNHILNTLLVKACDSVFGTSEFVFRVPNLAALAFYLFFVWMLLRRASRFLPPVAGFILICANPFLLDLFSAARGYGLSLGFLLPALYLLAKALEVNSSSREPGILVFLLLAAAVLASYLLLNVYLAALLVWLTAVAIRLSRRRPPPSPVWILSETLRHNSLVLVISAALAAATGPVIYALRRTGGLYWGGTSGFWRDSVGSLVKASLYGARYSSSAEPLLLGLIVASAGIIALPYCLPFVRRRDPTRMGVFTGISALTGLSVAAISLEHWLFRVKYPVDRMGTFLVPLFIISLWMALELVLGPAPLVLRKGARIAVVVLAAASLIHLARVGSLRVSYLWQYDLDTPEMLADLARLRGPSPTRGIRLGISPFLTPGIDYYRVVQELAWLQPMNQSGPWGDYDFIYIRPSLEAEAQTRGYRLLRMYPHTGNSLWVPPSSRQKKDPRSLEGPHK